MLEINSKNQKATAKKENLRTEIEDMRKNQTKVLELKNSQNKKLSGWLAQQQNTEERQKKKKALEDKTLENIQSEQDTKQTETNETEPQGL